MEFLKFLRLSVGFLRQSLEQAIDPLFFDLIEI